MSVASLCEVQVLSGRKEGAAHALPLGTLSVGTTLEAEFFIGCADMWHRLLRADSSANLRSATPSVDALPEQLMQSVLTHTHSGIFLQVEIGFAEVGQKRLLPGDRCTVPLDTVVRIGSSRLIIQSVAHRDELHSASIASNAFKHHWLNHKAVFTGITAAAVLALSASIFIKPPSITQTPLEQTAQIMDESEFSEKIVAVVNSHPAFFMTASGRRYDVGEVVDDGYKVMAIDGSNIELQRGSERFLMPF